MVILLRPLNYKLWLFAVFQFCDIWQLKWKTSYMDLFLEILKFALPSIFLLVMTYLMLSNFMDNEEKRRSYFLKKETQKSALPIRMQAYERMAMFLERITLDRLLVRLPVKDMNVGQYRHLLVDIIRQEFEHNLSQQIYMSENAWRLIVRAKSTTVTLINNAAAELREEDKAIELSKKLLNQVMEMENYPTKQALVYIKGEVKRNF